MLNVIKQLWQKDESASIAMERLHIIVSHNKGGNKKKDYINKMRQDLIAVIEKYVNVDDEQVQISVDNSGGNDMLEINIALPEED